MDYVLWEISWVNLSMLLATIPSYESEEKEELPIMDKKDTKSLKDFFKSA